jgi:hypothetical protein
LQERTDGARSPIQIRERQMAAFRFSIKQVSVNPLIRM